MTLDKRLTIRPTALDLAHLALIAEHMRATGQPFVNRTDALRHALATVAQSVAGAKRC